MSRILTPPLLAAVLIFSFTGHTEGRPDSEPGHLSAKSLSIKSADGKHSIYLGAFGSGAGIWVSGPGPVQAHVISSGAGVYIGIQKDGTKDLADQFAVFLDADGKPLLQVVADGKVKHIDLSKVAKAVKE